MKETGGNKAGIPQISRRGVEPRNLLKGIADKKERVELLAEVKTQ